MLPRSTARFAALGIASIFALASNSLAGDAACDGCASGNGFLRRPYMQRSYFLPSVHNALHRRHLASVEYYTPTSYPCIDPTYKVQKFCCPYASSEGVFPYAFVGAPAVAAAKE
jgi:hypothetical protein